MRKIFRVLLTLFAAVFCAAAFSACGLIGGGGSSSEKTITISAAGRAELTESVAITADLNFSPFEEYLRYEFVGENGIGATFVKEKKDGKEQTCVRADAVGTVSIRLVYDYKKDGNTAYAESNTLSVTFYANEITNAAELKAIAGSNKSYTLAADVDLSGEENWQPIADFSGVLFGGGHKIRNLTISAVGAENVGLFSDLSGRVVGLTVENAEISCRGDAKNVGVVAGKNLGLVKDCMVSGTVTAKFYSAVGGVAGTSNGSVIGCVSEAAVAGGDQTGGVVGYVALDKESVLWDCVSRGRVDGKQSVGGVAGYVTTLENEGDYLLQRNTNEGPVSGKEKTGGVFGSVCGISYSSWPTKYTYLNISVCDNKGDVTSAGDYAAGIVAYGIQLNTVASSENTADVTGGNYVGGTVGYAANTEIQANEFKNNNVITGKAYVGGFAGYAGLIRYAVNNGMALSTGLVVEEGSGNSYLGGVAGYCTGLIGCSNNSDISASGNYVGGLAGCVKMPEFDLFRDNENSGAVSGKGSVGGIVGYLTAENKEGVYRIKNDVNRGSVRGETMIGGICGTVYGVAYSSWPTLYAYFEISVVTNYADVTATGDYAGGFVGHATRLSTVATSENKADITGTNYVGGFVGYAPDLNIRATGSVNENKISGKGYLGGFAGYCGVVEDAVNGGVIESLGGVAEQGAFRAYLGGIAGYCTGAVGCTNNVDITAQGNGSYVGGIAGYVTLANDRSVQDNANNGSVTGGDETGGIAGYIAVAEKESNYTVKNNKNAGVVTGKSNVGGIVGFVKGISFSSWPTLYSYVEVSYCENRGEVVGSDTVGGIVGGYLYLATDENILATNATLYGNLLGM